MGLRPWAAGLTACVVAACAGPPGVWYGLSPDHGTAFTVTPAADGACIRVEDGAPRCFDGVGLPRVAFSPDGRRMAVPVRTGESWRLLVDDTLGPATDGIGELVFSPDGRRLAYTTLQGGRWRVVVDGVPGEPFDSLFAGSLRFDPTGRRHAVVAWDEGRALPVVDGVAASTHDGVGAIAFSDDGRRVAWVARDADGQRLMVDGAPGRSHERVTEFAFAPDGRGVAYIARDAGLDWVYDADGRLGPFTEARALAYRPTDGALAYVIRSDAGERLVLDDEPGPLFGTVDPPSFGSEPGSWGYVAHDSTESTVVLAGRVVATHPWAGNLVWGGEDRYAYLVRNVDADVVMHDRGVAEYDLVVDGTLQFVEGRWAWMAGEFGGRELYVVVEGVEGTRPLEWQALEGVAGTRAGGGDRISLAIDPLAAWVAAEARRALREAGSGR